MRQNQSISKGSILLSSLLATVSAITLTSCSTGASNVSRTEKPDVVTLPTTQLTKSPDFTPLFSIPFFKPTIEILDDYVRVIPPESEMALDKISVNFNSRSKMPVVSYSKTSSVRLVQVETQNSGVAAEISSSGRISFPKKYHGESATDILQTSAENIASMEVNTRLLDSGYMLELPSPTMRYATQHADIMSFSYVPQQDRTITLERTKSSPASMRVQNPEIKAGIKSMFERSNVVTFVAAGNEGHKNAKNMQWGSEFIINFNETHISVGALFVDNKGEPFATSYTSSSSPTVLSSNPYEFGFSYNYYRDRADIEKIIDAEIDKVTTVPSGSSCSTKDKESSWYKTIEEYEGEVYASILTRQERQTLRNALRQCYLSAYESKTQDTIYGTSFATPHLAGLAGGVLAKMRDHYGENALTPDELVAAIILSAQPIMRTEKKGMRSPLYLSYGVTPSGLFFNDNIAGFGYVDPKEFESIAEQIARTSSINPLLKPHQVNTTVTSPSYADERTDDGFKRYRLPVVNDFTVTRIIAEFQFSGDPLDRTDIIYLQAPTGEKFRVSLTREKNTDKYVFAFTNGMYGSSSKGEWSVLIPEDSASISSANLTFHGVNKGSSIDIALRKRVESQYTENPECKSSWQKLNPMRFKIS